MKDNTFNNNNKKIVHKDQFRYPNVNKEVKPVLWSKEKNNLR